MTAFILAVGIMGLTLLQVMSLKGARGGRSLGTAVQVGETIMDQIEMEGRLSWLNITASQYAAPSALTHLLYINKVPSTLFPTPIPLATPPFATFTIKGEVPVANPPDPTDSASFYNVYISQTNNVGVAATGLTSDFTVNVQFSEQVNPATGLAIPRTVTITRRILHG
jgi:hypothetical protein